MRSTANFVSPIVALSVSLFIIGGAIAAPPKVTFLYPAGAARGSTVNVTATGEFSAWPVEAWASQPGVKVEAEKEKGKFKVTVATDASLGVCWLRAFNGEGASTPRPFVIGTLPETNETEPNDTLEKPQLIAAEPITINGRLEKLGDVDSFVVWLTKGQTLVAALQANNEIGSPMDGALQICSLHRFEPPAGNLAASANTTKPQPKSSKTIAADGKFREPVESFVLEHNDDSAGLDPRAVLVAPRDGLYLVRVVGFPLVATSRIGFGGAEDYVYRLTLTTRGFLDNCVPLAVQRGTTPGLSAKLFGWNLAETSLDFAIPAATNGDSRVPASGDHVTLFRDDVANTLTIPVVDHAVIFDEEKTPEAAPTISFPATITGRIQAPRDRDAYAFVARKGDKLRFVVEARGLGFDLDPQLLITNEAGEVVAEMDDAARDQRDVDLKFTVLADGSYRLTIRDIHGQGGLRYAYRITASATSPNFTATVAADAFTLSGDKPLEIPLTVARLDGLNQPIEFQVFGLPAGYTSEPVVSAPTGETAKAVKLKITAEKDAAPFDGLIRITGRTEGKVNLLRRAQFSSTPIGSEIWLTARPTTAEAAGQR